MKCIGGRGRHQLIEAIPEGKKVERAEWRDTLSRAGESLRDDHGGPYNGPVMVRAVLTLNRPKSVPVTARWWPYRKGTADVDKLLRMVLDGLADGGLFGDDVQVVFAAAAKVYPDTPAEALTVAGIPTFAQLDRSGAVITIRSLPEQETGHV